MAIIRLTVEKFLASAAEYWTNVYHVDAEPGSTTTVMQDLVDAERPLYNSDIIITKVSQDDVAVDSNYAQPYIVNLGGTETLTGDRLPLFVCARLDLVYAGSRPGRKYIRGALWELESSFTSIGANMITRMNGYLTALLAIDGLCDADGDALVSGAVYPAPAMRQLRRGSKKSVTP